MLVCLLLPLLGHPHLMLMALVLPLLEVLVLFVFSWVLLLLVLPNELQVVGRLVLVDIEIEVFFEHKMRACFCCLEIVHKAVKFSYQVEPIYHSTLLSPQQEDVAEETCLQVHVVLLLLLRKLLDKSLERFTRLSLCGSRAASKELSDTILKDLVDEVLITEGLLFLSVLANHAHNLAQAVRVVQVLAAYSGKRLNFAQEKINVVSHLLFFGAF